MGHYSDDYEYEDNKRRAREKMSQHDAKKALRKALELADSCKPYDKQNYCTKIEEALFWLEGPHTD
jgi:hypothetical protein